jgi:cytosine/adenosine deaminase-related metal-dependent hydrolase
MFTEMRTASLLQKLLKGPEALPARRALRMATIDGARALGLAEEIGSVEAGKRADLVVVDLQRTHTTPRPDVVSTLIYAAETSDVRTVLIDGEVVLEDGELKTLDEREVIGDAERESASLSSRLSL